ncbi:hypothetical protein [Georgenia wutianyii]|nr:hypothetical protein [Georgenia wutianyii]
MSTSYGSTPQEKEPRAGSDARSSESPGRDRQSVVKREKEEYGGVKIGSAFFGWLTATGAAALLTALITGIATAIGLASDLGLTQAADAADDNAQTIGIVGAIVAAVILFIAYFCGGYVAGRMARFDGVKQGVAVWVWAVVIVIVLAVLGVIAGQNVIGQGQLANIPIPIDTDDLTTTAVITVVAAALVSLLGAILGGRAGMHYHRKVDEAGLGR